MRTPYYESTIHRQIREKRENRKDRIKDDVELYGESVLQSDEMKQAYQQTHHRWATVGEHTMRVTLTSVMICYALKKLNIKVNIPAVVVGALCHDLGILGRYEKYSSNKECSREHPKDSVLVARELVSELPEKTEDIIERHMWPAGQSKVPNSVEGAVVSVADKYTAVKDLVKGSDVKNTGVRNVTLGARDKITEKLSDVKNTDVRNVTLGARDKIAEKLSDVKNTDIINAALETKDKIAEKLGEEIRFEKHTEDD